ncbi:hypothetical protein H4R33_002746 [Dimargaris cristalligena]|nr:hypothetical protein H4R33_002746 [Dimargaris cristalligena]
MKAVVILFATLLHCCLAGPLERRHDHTKGPADALAEINKQQALAGSWNKSADKNGGH